MNRVFFWVEEYLFYPKKLSQRLVSFLLLPFTLIYCLIVVAKRITKKKISFDLPIISVGNLSIGGNGKTPFLISLCKNRSNIAIILRGYNRKSKNMIIVSEFGNIKCTVQECGDEAMLYAKSLPMAIIIVSINRIEAIKFAKNKNVKAIFLDDAFHHSEIDKFDILLKPFKNYQNTFCIPSGPYREPKSFYKKANIIATEDIDFQREVKITNKTDKMILITAISKPERLDKYLPKKGIIKKIYFKDHYNFNKIELLNLIKKYGATSILTTTKDAVKMENFKFNLSILNLHIMIKPYILENIDEFIDNFGKIK